MLIQNLWCICNCHIVCNKIIKICGNFIQTEKITNFCTGLGINLIESVFNGMILFWFVTLFAQVFIHALKESLVILVARSSDRLRFKWFKHIYQWECVNLSHWKILKNWLIARMFFVRFRSHVFTTCNW